MVPVHPLGLSLLVIVHITDYHTYVSIYSSDLSFELWPLTSENPAGHRHLNSNLTIQYLGSFLSALWSIVGWLTISVSLPVFQSLLFGSFSRSSAQFSTVLNFSLGLHLVRRGPSLSCPFPDLSLQRRFSSLGLQEQCESKSFPSRSSYLGLACLGNLTW